MPLPTANALDPDKVVELLAPGGAISRILKGFEPRGEQQEMLRNIINAYNNSCSTLIEAGTGTGKSLAYLLPAVIWALDQNERTLISTHTIHLQEQLLYKDIPLLTEALGVDIKAVLVKGMSNYVCLRKLHDVHQEMLLLPEEEKEELQRIEGWSQKTLDGSRSDLPFAPSHDAWEKVCAESDTCNRDKCPFYKQCHFFNSRRAAADAHILISNHSLFFSDLSYREQTNGQGILPDYQRVVLDEAHNIEEIATEHFASRVSIMMVARTLGRLLGHRNEKAYGKIPLLKQILQDYFRNELPKIAHPLLTALDIDLPAMGQEVWRQCGFLFQSFSELIDTQAPTGNDETGSENKLRILPAHKEHMIWKEEVVPKCNSFLEHLRRYIESLRYLVGAIPALKDDTLDEKTQGTRLDISAFADRLDLYGKTIEDFVLGMESPETVRWVESYMTRSMNNVVLMDAKLDISKTMADSLFNKFPTTVLCSATLTTNNKFDFIKRRLGLVPELMPYREITEKQYDSPFNYSEQSLLVVPTDMPNPTHPQFTQAAIEKILMSVLASRGNAFVLFTSYNMLKQCYNMLADRLAEHKLTPMKQGDGTRTALINKFKSTRGAVLFGTDSFWEGVDVAGDALRCVVIVKLPFKVPSEPLTQARTEAISARGGDPFMEYTIPNAIVKFKQGFGRLIRNKNDRGCIVCLDSRLISKGYGKLFLNSLPPCQTLFTDTATAQAGMVDFYRKTYYLVKRA